MTMSHVLMRNRDTGRTAFVVSMFYRQNAEAIANGYNAAAADAGRGEVLAWVVDSPDRPDFPLVTVADVLWSLPDVTNPFARAAMVDVGRLL